MSEEENKIIPVPQKYLDALDLIEEIYEHSVVGGIMHIVLDDRNLGNDSLLYCLELAAGYANTPEKWPDMDHWTHTEWVAIELCPLMLAMDMKERECLMELWDRKRQGLVL